MPNDITLDSEVLERNFKSKLHQVLVNHMVTNAKPSETRTIMSSKELVAARETAPTAIRVMSEVTVIVDDSESVNNLGIK